MKLIFTSYKNNCKKDYAKKSGRTQRIAPVFDPDQEPEFEHEQIGQAIRYVYEGLKGKKADNVEKPLKTTEIPSDNPSDTK